MWQPIKVYLQYLLPQHLLTTFAGWCAEIKIKWLKNFLITRFVKKYAVNMNEAQIEDPYAYPTFNAFFTRHLKPAMRPILGNANAVISPVDGVISEIGQIHAQSLLQAKHMYFDLLTLLGGDQATAALFQDGLFATLYLAPKDYHRIHMPFSGTLQKTIFVPGKLFSVNRMTSQLIPQLFSRNERLVCLFDTAIGPMAVILVGAMIVGSIQTVWMDEPIKSKQLITTPLTNHLTLHKGDELGLFKLGSTVILLFPKNKINWLASLKSQQAIKFGEVLANSHLSFV